MDPAIKEKWVAALRSGAYEQGRNQLRTANGYCCLGVLCDLIDPDGWVGNRHYGEHTMPGDAVIKAAGLFDEFDIPRLNVTIEGRDASIDLHNDGADLREIPPRTFAEIADAIEEQL